jgi:tetratricopeptide (TPR) repeat protein
MDVKPHTSSGPKVQAQKKKRRMGRGQRFYVACRQDHQSDPRPEESRSGSYTAGLSSRTYLAVGAFLVATATFWTLGGPAYFTNHLALRAVLSLDIKAAEYWSTWSRRLAPDDAQTRLILARLARRRGDFVEMQDHLQIARKSGQQDDRVTREWMLADAQQSKLATIEPQLNRWLLAQDPDSAEICDAYVNGLLAASRHEMAQRVLDAWQADFPSDPRPYYRRGRLLQHFDRLADAEAELRHAVALKPDYYPALYALGRVLNEQKRSSDAIAIYQSCMQMPNPLAARIAMAQALAAAGKTDAAERHLREILRADVSEIMDSYRRIDESPELFVAAYELGNLLVNAGNHEDAIGVLRRALDFNSRDTGARYSLAMALRGAGKVDESEQELQIVQTARQELAKVNQLRNLINRDPENTDARLELGELLFRHESPRNGLFWLRSVFSYDPDNELAKAKIAELTAQTQAGGWAASVPTVAFPQSP